MIIDSHAHVVLPVEKHIEMMDSSGIDKTILFSTLVHPEKSESYDEFIQEMDVLNQILNNEINPLEARVKALEELRDAIAKYPDRFIGFGSVPLLSSSGELRDWVEKIVKDYKMKGLGEFTLGSGQIKMLEPVFQAAGDYNSFPIWVHTFHPLNLNDIQELFALTRKYPTVPVIYGHLGGIHWQQVIALTKETKNAYLDISAFYTTYALSLAIKELPEKTLFSSDFPYGDPFLNKLAVERHASSEEVVQRVLGGNIANLLKI
ncbi:amidohydrolase family protein [Bacillus velezensis]|uniref:amidohydrolase family protein n=1 Tax=Bacillus velezensis TaxID=492670 RepID=UPI00280C9E0C|nr:amidohydrolase family protein [Bacillus velezensis]MDQ9148868.1 amidohydrolase family protein [Bacillus velezensis]MEC2185019.1 amidohydrolase family protein [Bacillus velezensis]